MARLPQENLLRPVIGLVAFFFSFFFVEGSEFTFLSFSIIYVLPLIILYHRLSHLHLRRLVSIFYLFFVYLFASIIRIYAFSHVGLDLTNFFPLVLSVGTGLGHPSASEPSCSNSFISETFSNGWITSYYDTQGEAESSLRQPAAPQHVLQNGEGSSAQGGGGDLSDVVRPFLRAEGDSSIGIQNSVNREVGVDDTSRWQFFSALEQRMETDSELATILEDVERMETQCDLLFDSIIRMTLRELNERNLILVQQNEWNTAFYNDFHEVKYAVEKVLDDAVTSEMEIEQKLLHYQELHNAFREGLFPDIVDTLISFGHAGLMDLQEEIQTGRA